MPAERYTTTGGRVWEDDSNHDEYAPVKDASVMFNPARGVLTVTFTLEDGEGFEVGLPVKASGNWNAFVASLPLWTEGNDVTGEVTDGDDNDSD